MPHRTAQADGVDGARPEWFAQFLADRGTRKPSAHTLKAYRQDFDAIAALLAGDTARPGAPTAGDHRHRSDALGVRRVRPHPRGRLDSALLVDLECAVHLPVHRRADPGQPDADDRTTQTTQGAAQVPAPRVGHRPAGRGVDSAAATARSTDWLERDRALILTGLLAGLRADELVRANIGDLRRTDDGAVLQVRGKGDKDRRIPVEPVLVDVLEHYLDSRKTRFPHTTRRSSPTGGLAAWPASAPLFVGGDGQRITRGTLQYRVLRAFRQAGIDGTRAKGALLHGLRHTFATELANADVSVYALMNLLGHESMTTSQRYITAAGTDTRTAAAQNKLYGLLEQER